MIIPGFGIVSHVVSTFSAKPIFGYCSQNTLSRYSRGKVLLILACIIYCYSLPNPHTTPLCFTLVAAAVVPMTTNPNPMSRLEWAAGLIDGDGYIGLSRGKYASLEVTIEHRDIHCLELLVTLFGGTISPSGLGALRWRLHNKAAVVAALTALMGLLHNPVRLAQLARVCVVYNIPYLAPKPLHFTSSYLAGLIDSDGSVTANWASIQIIVSVS